MVLMEDEILRPFRADDWGNRYPGRCPGLVTSAPLARRNGTACAYHRAINLVAALKALTSNSPGQHPGLRKHDSWAP
jgi:hypothetical protein